MNILYPRTIALSDTGLTSVENYLKVTNEFAYLNLQLNIQNARDSYMVGALARFNINHNKLLARAKLLPLIWV